MTDIAHIISKNLTYSKAFVEGSLYRTFYDEGLLALHPTPKLEDQLLCAVCNCLFDIFAATVHIWRLCPHQIKVAPCCGNKGPTWCGNLKIKI
jgi:hypothetical protein